MLCRCTGGELCSPSGVRDAELEDFLWVCGFLGGGADDPGSVGVLHHQLEVSYHRDLCVGDFHAVFMVVS